MKNDVIVATIHNSESDKSELWLIPAALAVPRELRAGEYRVSQGQNESVVSLAADGAAVRGDRMAGMWQGTREFLLIAWLDGSREAWVFQGSEIERSVFRPWTSAAGKPIPAGSVQSSQ
jgi:hypothetical protein